VTSFGVLVEMWRRYGGDEELAAVGVGPSVRHRQQKRLLVAQRKVLIYHAHARARMDQYAAR